MAPKIHFFIGKGGVGKSTTSALTAVHLAEAAFDTLLVSMDAAHNQRDIFRRAFSEKPVLIEKHLQVKEVDSDYWVEKYLKETQSMLNRVYGYQSAFSLENYFHVLRYSPGLEEYALLLAFEHIVSTRGNIDVLVFDMAPTALSLRFFSLPYVTLMWLEELLKLRKQIYEKKEIVSRIKFGKKEIEQDKVKNKLEKMISSYRHIRDLFSSDKTNIHLVMDGDELSFSESVRIRKKLTDLGMNIESVFVNKLQQCKIPKRIEKEFDEQRITPLPFSDESLLGITSLHDFADRNRSGFDFIVERSYRGG